MTKRGRERTYRGEGGDFVGDSNKHLCELVQSKVTVLVGVILVKNVLTGECKAFGGEPVDPERKSVTETYIFSNCFSARGYFFRILSVQSQTILTHVHQ